MTIDIQDELVRAYALLKSLRKNIDKLPGDINTTFIQEYHAILDKLEGIRINVSDFRIPDTEIKPVVTSFNTITRASTYSREKYIGKNYFIIKLDAVLTYFKIVTSPEKKQIGFHKSE